MKGLYSVGEFSQLFGLNVQTLRYYDSIGLFNPDFRDPKTARRSYKFDQVYGLATIRFLRRIGYSLDDIQSFLNDREAKSTLGILNRRADELQRQLDDLTRTTNAIRRKLDFVEHEMAAAKNLSDISVRTFGPRKYIPIGGEETLYVDDSFYLYPTIAFYVGKLKTFGAYLYGEGAEAEAARGAVEPGVIPPADYLCGYHVGPYETIHTTAHLIRESHPDLLLGECTNNFNIIDQFVEKDSGNYITSVQIEILK